MIGIFDSGVGGLTVVKEIFKYLPDCQIIYFGDSARLPYGTRGAGFVKKYSEKITEWLLHKNARIIIVACNTASSLAADYLKTKFKGVPIFEMIDPAIAGAIAATKNKKIGIIGTRGTIKSNTYQEKFKEADASLQIFSQPCPLLVPLVEEGMLDDEVTIQMLKKYINPLKEKGIDTLVLACTHYPLLLAKIQKYVPQKVKIISQGKIVAKSFKDYLIRHPELESKCSKSSTRMFYTTDSPESFNKQASTFYGVTIRSLKVSLT